MPSSKKMSIISENLKDFPWIPHFSPKQEKFFNGWNITNNIPAHPDRPEARRIFCDSLFGETAFGDIISFWSGVSSRVRKMSLWYILYIWLINDEIWLQIKLKTKQANSSVPLHCLKLDAVTLNYWYIGTILNIIIRYCILETEAVPPNRYWKSITWRAAGAARAIQSKACVQ